LEEPIELIPATGLLVATGIGLLIGLERGWRQRREQAGTRIAGIRTFAILGLGGGLCGLASTTLSVWFGVVGMAGLVISLLLAHRARLAEPGDNVSATNVVVGIVTALLGLLAAIGYEREALIAGGLTALILSMREPLHGWIATLGESDIRAAGQYAAIALVILPLLPDQNIGPYGALNARALWLVVVFVTGLSFAGYWAAKRIGNARGTILAAAIGATYSSTAVTAELSRRLRDPAEHRATLNAGIAAATAMMPIRVMILCAVLIPSAAGSFATGIGASIAFTAVFAAWSVTRADRSQGRQIPVARSPFALLPAVGFAVLVGVVVVVSHWVIDTMGTGALAALVAVTGLYDVDAAVIMVANLPDGRLAGPRLGVLLTLPILANTLLKAVMVVALGGLRAGARAAIPLFIAAILILGGLAILVRMSGLP
jgi:uncharacterized membrane protein (DUF4010 family)